MKTIALTASTIEKGYKLYSSYVNFVLLGGEAIGETVLPVILPFTEDEGVIRGYAEEFDGYLCTGGDDVDPAYYGEERHPKCGEGEPERDRFELALLRELIARDRPVFGICRGIQVMNVALGGTLWQDISAEVIGEESPHWLDTPDGRRHTVYPSGSLADLLGSSEILTNSGEGSGGRTEDPRPLPRRADRGGGIREADLLQSRPVAPGDLPGRGQYETDFGLSQELPPRLIPAGENGGQHEPRTV